MKKTLILVLVLICICTSVFSGRAQAAEIVDSGNCGEKAFWSLDTEGKLLIWGEGKAKGCTYPSPTAWGKYKEDILSVVISDGITEIQDWAFYYCSNLESAEIPVGFTEIPDNAFDGCKLSSIIIPEGVKKIGENAFASCPLYTLQLPSTLEVIEKRAFFGIRAESVTIPENVVGMADGAFDSTWTLKEVHFLGNAPQMDYSKLWFLQDLFTSSTTIYYRPEKKGWQTPKWRGYACYPEKDGEQPTPTPVVDCSHVDDLGYALYGEILKTWREYPYFGTADSCYVVEYDSYICSACGETATWYSDWYDDHVFGANGVCGNCGYTADGVYVGTGGTPTPNPTNAPTPVPTAMPTTVPTSTPTTVPTAIPAKTAKTLDELTDVDYLAFASLAYEDAQQYMTVEQMLKNLKKWDKSWEGIDIYYHELYSRIKDWYVYDCSKDTTTGFYATVFASRYSNDVVIAYRGSIPFDVIDDPLEYLDAYNDWILNDIPPIACDAESTKSQYYNAIEVYNDLLAFRDVDEIAVTGHSLGGGLANTVSAYSGCKGVAFNGVAILDMFYFNHYLDMSRNFSGINNWNFIDHVNEYDTLAGMWQVGQKNAYIHESLENRKADLIDNFVNHSLHPMIFKDSNGTLQLTKYEEQPAYEVARYLGVDDKDDVFPAILEGAINAISVKDRMLFLGTTRSNHYEITDSRSFGGILPYDIPVVALAGNGNDSLVAGRGEDCLIGGKDNDILDGSWDDDIYIYYKGDGVDIIQDTAGKDTIYLYGFDKNDQIEILSTSEQHIFYEYIYTDNGGIKYNVWGTPGAGDHLTPPVIDVDWDCIPLSEHIPAQEYSAVLCGGKEILKIANGRSNNRANKLAIVTENGKEIDVTPYLDLRWITKRIELNCPIDVEILDASGNVVYTLYDSKPGSYYTAYGNFYVTPLENSTHCSKVLDLFEGYSIRIKGIGNGTMDISVYDTDGHTLFDPVGAEDVIITPKTIATLEEDSATGKIVLVVDNDGNGTSDGEVMLLPVHPNEEDYDHPLMKVEAVEPTCVENGNTEYYLCSCGKMFSDSEGMNEIADPNSVILPLTEEHQYNNGVCKVCSQKEANPEDLPQTGDQSQFGVWLALLAVSSIVGINFARKSRNA